MCVGAMFMNGFIAMSVANARGVGLLDYTTAVKA